MPSSFAFYLRTGRRLASPASEIGTKFNPWHDPEDGRFTFAGQGNFFGANLRPASRRQLSGFPGGGGSYGGGGVTGSWAAPAIEPRRGSARQTGKAPAQLARRPLNQPQTPPLLTTKPAPLNSRTPNSRTGRPADPRLTIRKNGYEFSTDAHARPRRVFGEIKLQQQPRSRSAQANAGKPDRRNTDDGGHFIAARFNGPQDWFNHFAQDANFNRGSYRALEDEWAKAVRSGKRVLVDIVPHYRELSMRPHKLTVVYYVDGERKVQQLRNEKKGK